VEYIKYFGDPEIASTSKEVSQWQDGCHCEKASETPPKQSKMWKAVSLLQLWCC